MVNIQRVLNVLTADVGLDTDGVNVIRLDVRQIKPHVYTCTLVLEDLTVPELTKVECGVILGGERQTTAHVKCTPAHSFQRKDNMMLTDILKTAEAHCCDGSACVYFMRDGKEIPCILAGYIDIDHEDVAVSKYLGSLEHLGTLGDPRHIVRFKSHHIKSITVDNFGVAIVIDAAQTKGE